MHVANLYEAIDLLCSLDSNPWQPCYSQENPTIRGISLSGPLGRFYVLCDHDSRKVFLRVAFELEQLTGSNEFTLQMLAKPLLRERKATVSYQTQHQALLHVPTSVQIHKTDVSSLEEAIKQALALAILIRSITDHPKTADGQIIISTHIENPAFSTMPWTEMRVH